MWFSYKQETDWYPLPISDVQKVQEMNKKGEKPELIGASGLVITTKVEENKPLNYDLMQMDKKYNSKKKKNKNRHNRHKPGGNNFSSPKQND